MNLDSFRIWLARTGRKPSTIRLHARNLLFLSSRCSPFTKETIETWLFDKLQAGASPKYINNYIDSVAVWGHFLGEDWKIKQFKDKAAIKSTLSDEEIERIITMKPWYCRQSKEDFSRWSLFYKIMAYTGMRPGEVAHLTVDRVDFGRSVFCLEDTKTNEPRLVPISPALLPDLQSYIPTLTTSYLFARLRKGKVGDCVVGNEDWCYNFHVRLHRLGIKRPHLSVYSLRHSFITRLLEEDVNIFKVQKIVGHRRTDTTAVYTHLTTKDIVRTIEHDRLSWNKLDVHKKIEMIRDYIISLGLPTDQFETEITEHGIRVEIKAL